MVNLTNEHSLCATVTSIEWERIFLFMDVLVKTPEGNSFDEPLDFYLVNGLYRAKVKIPVVSLSNNIYKLKLNVANNGENRCIPQGTYQIFVCSGEKILTVADATYDIIQNVDVYSRNFLYANRASVYTVTFFIDEDTEEGGSMPLEIYMMASAKCGMDFPYFRGAFRIIYNSFKLALRSIKNTKLQCIRIYKFFCLIYKKNNKKNKTILFMSEQNDQLGSNLQAVYDRMCARGMDKSYSLLKSARKASSEAQPISSWIKLLKKIAKSDMIFIDDHAPIFDWLVLNQNTKLIQLWHAGAGFKSSGYSRWGHKGCPRPSSCHRQYAYGIAGSKNIAPFFSEVWGIKDEQVLPTGMPRMDEFLDPEYRKQREAELREKLPICKDKKVILFAPTYRGKNRKEAYYPYELIDFEKLYDVCSDEYIVLFKMHPWVNFPVPIEERFKDKFVDVGDYPNINDLFYITDLLITDYSSNIFEYSLMHKPMIFFAFDKIQYSFSRGFHRNYDKSAPGKICYDFEELLDAISKKDFEEQKVEEYVKHHFDYIDTHSSDRVIDWIILGNIPKDIVTSLEKINKENKEMAQLDFELGTIDENNDKELE